MRAKGERRIGHAGEAELLQSGTQLLVGAHEELLDVVATLPLLDALDEVTRPWSKRFQGRVALKPLRGNT